jgi:hypothetical protein
MLLLIIIGSYLYVCKSYVQFELLFAGGFQIDNGTLYVQCSLSRK